MPVVTASGTMEESFPDVDPNHVPLGQNVLIQIRVARRKASKDSDIELPDEVRATIQANTTVGKVIAVGPLAFKNRNSGQPWPEGAWVEVGEFVRVPRHGGERWEVPHGDGVVTFLQLADLQLGGKIPRPLDVIAYV